MKKIAFILFSLSIAVSGQAETKIYKAPKFTDNWSLGITGGVATPLKGHSFFQNMRGSFGFHVQKQISPVFAAGVEIDFIINSKSWIQNNPALLADGYDLTGHSTAGLDRIYAGAYGSVNLFNLFGGYNCGRRFFDIEVVGGAGWGWENLIHQNYFATKAGVKFNMNFSKNFTMSVRPSVTWNMSGSKYEPLNVAQTSAAYSINHATFGFALGFTYNSGKGFVCGDNNTGEIDELNAKVNALRGEIDACNASTAEVTGKNNTLKAELDACRNRKPEVVETVNNSLTSVRYVFYKIGSSKIGVDQQPNVEMVASYLKAHENSSVVIKGYASKDGNIELNKKLAAARAEAVKLMLVKKYGISANRIKAEGEGIGCMFSENDWNRVAICTLEK